MSYRVIHTKRAKVVRINYGPMQVLVELEDGRMMPATTNNKHVEYGSIGTAQFVKTPSSGAWYFSDN